MKNLRINLAQFAALLLAPCALFGWTLSVVNKSPYNAYLRVSYSSCNADNIFIAPGGQANVNADWCLVTQISGVLVVNSKNSGENIPINWQVWGGHIKFSATIAQQPNGKFGINASYW